MPRHRVFRTRAKCPGAANFSPDLSQFIGRSVEFQAASESDVNVILDGTLLGKLDERISAQVATALKRGQVFTAVVGKASPNHTEDLKPNGAQLDLKVEYMLDNGHPAIEAPSSWRAIEVDEAVPAPASFFTTVAGVTFEGRQRIVARCRAGERLLLVREPDNPKDSGAVKVMRTNGEQLGYLLRHVSRAGDSSGLAWRMDRGRRYECRIKDVTGGGDLNWGLNIEITELSGSEDREEDKTAGQGYSAIGSVPVPASEPIISGMGWVVALFILLMAAVAVMISN